MNSEIEKLYSKLIEEMCPYVKTVFICEDCNKDIDDCICNKKETKMEEDTFCCECYEPLCDLKNNNYWWSKGDDIYCVDCGSDDEESDEDE